MQEDLYFSHLYEIASHLNREFSLPAALRKALEKTVELLELETGWIWLTEQDQKSVYLAASYHLPPALSKHPERLSGWCYCIGKYLSGGIEEATNVSEIICTRLKDINTGTNNLKFHATIPIITRGQKIGLINLLHGESQQLDEKQLSLLNTISELVGIAVERTHLQNSFSANKSEHDQGLISRLIQPKVDAIAQSLKNAEKREKTLKMVENLKEEIRVIRDESSSSKPNPAEDFHYPASPLTKREMEVLELVKKGHTNSQIAESLFIAERTVKFHISAILSKLFAKTRTQAVNIALQRGLLS